MPPERTDQAFFHVVIDIGANVPNTGCRQILTVCAWIDGGGSVAAEGAKAVVRRWIEEVWNKQDLDLIDEIFAPSYTVNGRHVGPEGVRAAVGQLRPAG